jgi:hypothetical protein
MPVPVSRLRTVKKIPTSASLSLSHSVNSISTDTHTYTDTRTETHKPTHILGVAPADGLLDLDHAPAGALKRQASRRGHFGTLC